MRMGRKTLTAALMAGLFGTGVGLASSASAEVYRSPCSSGAYLSIVHYGWTNQCFSWDGVAGTGNYIFVNDWYNYVDAGMYNVTVSWHDISTGAWYTVSPGAWGKSYQPTSNSALYSITFNS